MITINFDQNQPIISYFTFPKIIVIIIIVIIREIIIIIILIIKIRYSALAVFPNAQTVAPLSFSLALSVSVQNNHVKRTL